MQVRRRCRGCPAPMSRHGACDSAVALSLDGDALGEVARLIDVGAAQIGDMVGQQLQGHGGEHRRQHRIDLRDVQDMVGVFGDALVALGGNSHHVALRAL